MEGSKSQKSFGLHLRFRHFQLVFAGPVAWTEKKTETEPNATESNRTISCGCLVWELVRLLVALIFKYKKTNKRPVAISCDWSFSCIYYIQYIQ